ncbi:Uncharacterised protein [Bordetella pertussis]|nr:Uncharacterised protein [Bordetella pertussis]CFW37542.1 Uncharacterised protein [Bordetella pertussis]
MAVPVPGRELTSAARCACPHWDRHTALRHERLTAKTVSVPRGAGTPFILYRYISPCDPFPCTCGVPSPSSAWPASPPPRHCTPPKPGPTVRSG